MLDSFVFLMIRRPPRTTRTDTLFPYTTLFRSRDAAQWVEAQKVAGLKLEVLRLPGRTPVIYFEVPATRKDNGDTVLMYGHLDKQPEFTGWRSDLGPWTPKYEDGIPAGRRGGQEWVITCKSTGPRTH